MEPGEQAALEKTVVEKGHGALWGGNQPASVEGAGMVPVRGIGSEHCAQAQLCSKKQRHSSRPHDPELHSPA